jgi:hypothetical protein
MDRRNPAKTRYWKLIYEETEATLGWWMPLSKIDKVITRWPPLRWLAWNMVMWRTDGIERRSKLFLLGDCATPMTSLKAYASRSGAPFVDVESSTAAHR